MSTISPEHALIYIMVTMSAVDRAMSDNELRDIGTIVKTLPAFRDFHEEKLIPAARECASILQEDGGLDAVFGLVKDALPVRLRETGYALAVEIAAADEFIGAEELRLLQLLRDTLEIDKLLAAAIERGARARHMPL
ncbi:tellurite resistance TerB family protein [Parvibaculum sp.]|jgi:tellurite resistance protein|uniref:tellurite resistance TerB family protein n=1 Tax=Parvibaculum sp. TaxID=2024848 RepID=UPI000C5030B4|nr:tellurite resistance TerB family protein [Parvibaculum sp.]MAM95006.1 Tellurite resistance protein TerB [Parvibaculum sp.]|tara:strand:+ start:2156 stop:2566 length:411 start_codon:yes stop_codon:yes gene_type:complete